MAVGDITKQMTGADSAIDHTEGSLEYLSGIEALAQLSLLQRQRDDAEGITTAGFISGYRGSPLAGLDQALWRLRPALTDNQVHFEPGLNEELAATAVWGSQQSQLFGDCKYGGVLGMWYAKAPGADRAADALRHANAAGTSRYGGVLAVFGDDHGCNSSTLPNQSEFLCKHVSMPLLYPSNVQELVDFGLLGWAMSRYSGAWVGLKCLIDTLDVSTTVDLDPHRRLITIPMAHRNLNRDLNVQWPDTPEDQEQKMMVDRLEAVRRFASHNNIDVYRSWGPSPNIGIVTTGKSHSDVSQALNLLCLDDSDLGRLGVSTYKVGLLWPIQADELSQYAKGLREILVVEEKSGIIEEQLRFVLYNRSEGNRPRIVGKSDESGRPLLPVTSEHSATYIAIVVARRILQNRPDEELQSRLRYLESLGSSNQVGEVDERTPYFCSGCPHSASTRIPAGSRALAGIGCHYMAQWMDRSTTTHSQMGGEGALWIGQAPFSNMQHIFANLGDGTYAHSGALAIRAAVAAGVNITYKILCNDAVAMTGGQSAESSTDPISIANQVTAEGVTKVAIVTNDTSRYGRLESVHRFDVFDRSRLNDVQQRLRDTQGVTVLIYDQICATEKRRKIKRGLLEKPRATVIINADVCEGCGDCGKVSNCVAIKPLETPLGTKRAIDSGLCNQDYTCVDGFCPSFVSVSDAVPRSLPLYDYGNSSNIELPDPNKLPLKCVYNIALAGIGGTGIVTIGRILGQAAHKEGLATTVLDVIGMAQKGGQVISHIKIAPSPAAIYSSRIAPGSADLLIGFDGVAAASTSALSLLNAALASVVLNLEQTPLSDFTQDPNHMYPSDAIQRSLLQLIHPNRIHSIQATEIARSLFGNAIASNLLQVGYAYQLGLLPLSETSIEKSIESVGVSVAQNLAAFRAGRVHAYDSYATTHLKGAGAMDVARTSDVDFASIVEDRVRRLSDYQSANYARDYGELIERVAQAERSTIGSSTLAEQAARSLYKLMAYKDEYEVARLYSDGTFQKQLRTQFEPGYRIKFHLAPPMISRREKATGHLIKRTYGPWVMGLFSLLARLRFLRGTPFDPFGYIPERRQERMLVQDFRSVLDEVICSLSSENFDVSLKIAALPGMIRGFGHVKDEAVAAYLQDQSQLLEMLRSTCSRE